MASTAVMGGSTVWVPVQLGASEVRTTWPGMKRIGSLTGRAGRVQSAQVNPGMAGLPTEPLSVKLRGPVTVTVQVPLTMAGKKMPLTFTWLPVAYPWSATVSMVSGVPSRTAAISLCGHSAPLTSLSTQMRIGLDTCLLPRRSEANTARQAQPSVTKLASVSSWVPPHSGLAAPASCLGMVQTAAELAPPAPP